MPRYKVYLTETVKYSVEVDAENDDAAEDLALEVWAESEDTFGDFDGSGQGVEVDYSERLDAEKTEDLTAEYQAWLKVHPHIKEMPAEELLALNTLNMFDQSWLEDFCERWDKAQAAETAAA